MLVFVFYYSSLCYEWKKTVKGWLFEALGLGNGFVYSYTCCLQACDWTDCVPLDEK